tara:strand:- start:520 stop:2916 length:2397 start_codon:yes stop_codon:yes gene_type:complete
VIKLIIITFISFLNAFTFQGRVIDAYAKPIKSANVEIINSKLGSSTDNDGQFLIKNVPLSKFKIKISHIGYEDYDTKIDLTSGKIEYSFKLNEKIENFNEIVVTGQRRKVYIKDSPILTRVINRKDIENSSYNNVKEILEMTVPNIQNVISSHAGISNNNVKIQGLDNKYILFMIDGAKVSGEFAGNLDFNMLDLSNVERIEIVDGGMSSLYGSNAIGGIINIITRKTSKPYSFSITYQNEKPMITSNSINAGIKYKDFSYNTNFVFQNTDGYSLSPSNISAGQIVKTQEEFSSNSFTNKLSYFFATNHYDGSIDLNYKRYKNKIRQYKNYTIQVLDWEDPNFPSYVYQTQLNGTPIFKDDRYNINFEIHNSNSNFIIKYDYENYRKYSYFFNYNELRCNQFNCNEIDTLTQKEFLNASNVNKTISIQYNRKIKNHDIILGFENKRDRYSSYSIYRNDHQEGYGCKLECGLDLVSGNYLCEDDEDWNEDNFYPIETMNLCWSESVFGNDSTLGYDKKAFFVGDQITFKNKNKINLSLRNIDSENFGSNFVYSFSYLDKNLILNHNIRFNFSKGFRTPSIKELYYDFQSHPPPIIGNKDLQSTTNNYTSISLEKSISKKEYSFELFYNDVRDMIGTISTFQVSVDNDTTDVIMYDNYKSVFLSGFNSHYKIRFNNNDVLKGFYNYTLPKSRYNSALELISKYSFRLSYNKYLDEKVNFIINVKYNGPKYIYLNEKTKLDGFAMVDFLGSFKINDNLFVKLGVKNLLNYVDERRFLDSGYEYLTSYDPGRRIFIDINLKQ